jgi:uncharacterized protein YjbI with pentapeptide repeats
MDNKKSLVWFIIILTIVLIGITISVPYWHSLPRWTGFEHKTAWDLLQLLIIPIVLAAGAILFSQSQRNTEIQIENERQRESALQSCIDRIKDLILDINAPEPITDSNADDAFEVLEMIGNFASVYTRATLQQLDGKRKGMLLEFLYYTHLIGWLEPSQSSWIPHRQVIYLGQGTDLTGLITNEITFHGVNLSFANLSNTKLVGMDLLMAHLDGCNMTNSSFVGVNFCAAEMGGTNLSNIKVGNGVIFEKAKIKFANLKNADLRKASLSNTDLEGTKYNRKTRFSKGFDPVKAKMIFEDS